MNNTAYISVSNTNTRITLLKSGWYRIHLSVLLWGVSPDSSYWIELLKDGVRELYLDRYEQSTTVDSVMYSVDSSSFVYSNGTNYIEINGEADDDFWANTDDTFNQLTIEFVNM